MTSWLAYHRSAEADDLQELHPHAFLLLCQIARRARLTPCPITGLQIGQAFIGDYKKAGIPSERNYRTSKEILKKCRFATFKATGNGTVATLMEQGVFSISITEATGAATGSRQASDRQATTKIQRYNETKRTKNIYSSDGDILKSVWQMIPAQGRERSSQQKVKAAWEKIPTSERPSKEAVIAALDAWSESKSWTDQGGQFVPGAHRWLAERQWENSPTKTPSKKLTKLEWE